MKDIEIRLQALETRNKRVEKDKKWETSTLRRLLITILTYVLVSIYLAITDNEKPLVAAVVPALGYFLSTLAINIARRKWSQNT